MRQLSARTRIFIGVAVLVQAPKLFESSFAAAPWIAGLYLSFLLAAGAVLFLGWRIARSICVPRGWVRAAQFFASHSYVELAASARDVGRVAAAWSLSFRTDRTTLEDTASRLGEVPEGHVFGALDMMTHGFLAAARGDLALARRLFDEAPLFATSATPGEMLEIARDYSIADAAASGDWPRAHALGADPAGTRRAKFLGMAASRLLGIEVIGAHRFRFAWVTSGAPFALRPIYERALRQAPGSAAEVAPEPVTLPSEAEGRPLTTAMTLELALARRPAASVLDRDLERLGRAWDAALLEAELLASRRARELGADPKGAMEVIVEDARDGLIALAERSRLDLGSLGEREPSSRILGDAARAHRNATMQDLEAHVEALRRRIEAKRALSLFDEWRDFDATRAAFEASLEVGGPPLRRIAFPAIHAPLCAFAVWLTNERRQPRLAHAVFSWLLKLARDVDDAEAIALEERNVRATSA
ncbi:MAG: hypothetical protein HYV07_08555 [Deltaproteobacteria bacterium]|nr:hypothetical protein [Deltaproteobacteria bacterium]